MHPSKNNSQLLYTSFIQVFVTVAAALIVVLLTMLLRPAPHATPISVGILVGPLVIGLALVDKLIRAENLWHRISQGIIFVAAFYTLLSIEYAYPPALAYVLAAFLEVLFGRAAIQVWAANSKKASVLLTCILGLLAICAILFLVILRRMWFLSAYYPL